MSSKPIDYDALAKQSGGQTAPGAMDYDALAAAHGAVNVPQPPKASDPGFLQKAKNYISSFVNEPLFPSAVEKAKQAGQLEQQQLNQIYGPESEKEFAAVPKFVQPLVKGVRQIATLPTSAARVAYNAMAITPMDATVLAASTAAGQPELAGGYFAAKAAGEAPQTLSTAVQNPTPENVEAGLGNLATIAGGASGAMQSKTGAPSVEQTAAQTAKNQAQLNKVGQLRKVARQITGVGPAVEDAVAKGAEKQQNAEAVTAAKNKAAIEKHQQAITRTAAENQAAQDEYTLSTEEAKQAAADKNTAAQQQYQQELQRHGEEQSAAEQALGLRKQTEADLQAKTDAYYNKETAAEAAADKANTANWDAWRAKVADVQMDPTPILQTINDVNARFPEAKQAIAQSMRSPEEMSAGQQQYVADRSAVMKQQGYGTDYDALNPEAKQNIDNLMQRLGINPPEGVAVDPTKPLPLQTIHELKSDIGWKLFRGEYPPTVTGAMKQVYSALQSAESRGSLQADALSELENARASHAQYQEAFGRSKPNRNYEGELRMKEANPEAYGAQQEDQRLAAVGKYDPSIPQAYRDVVATREKLKGMQTEDQLRKGLKQPPQAPESVEAKLPQPPEPVARPTAPEMKATPQTQVDIQKRSIAALRERAKNWGHYNARDIGILSSSVVLAPVMYLLGEAAFGHAGGASALAPLAAIGYESGKMGAARLLKSDTFRNWVTKTPADEVQALAKIPGADRIKIQDGLTQIVIDQFKKGNRTDISPELQNFLGPKNMAKISAASSSVATPGELKKRAQEIATPQQ